MIADRRADSTALPQRLLVAASGTGGHLFPALAVADAAAARWPNCHLAWLGVPDRLETKLVPDRYPLHTLRAAGFQERSLAHLCTTGQQLLAAVATARSILQQGKFQAVFTTGGYIAGPTIVAARSLGIPVLLHEANAMPGKVTRWLGPWCEGVALGFTAAAAHLGRRAAWTGTPVRQAFLQPAPLSDLPIPEDAPLIVVVGGSQGALGLNQRVRSAVPAWLAAGAVIVHLTGDRDPDALSLQQPGYVALPFYENMAGLFQRATLAVSRAGAGTLSELASTRTPSILVPYPFAADDHQTANARAFGAVGAAIVAPQAQLSAERLQTQVLTLLSDRPRLDRMAAAAAGLAVNDSAERLVDWLGQIL